jgi:hypothetical protein
MFISISNIKLKNLKKNIIEKEKIISVKNELNKFYLSEFS